MAEPQQNYLEGVNRARQQTRSGRRQRVSDLLNPLDSAATMDRLQGVELGDFSDAVDAPAMNVVAAVGSRGGGAPIRMAAGSNAAPRATTQTGNGCVIINGKKYCGGSAPNMFTQAPTTVAAPATAPKATTVPAPAVTRRDGESEGEFTYRQRMAEANSLRQRGLGLGEEAIGFAGGAPSTAGPMIVQGGRYADAAEQISGEAHRDRVFAQDVANANRAAEFIAKETNARAAKDYSEADVNTATARAVNQTTGVGRLNDSQAILADAVRTGATPVDYANAMEALDAGVEKTSGDMTLSIKPVTPEQAAKRKDGYLRQGFSAQAIHMLIASEQFHEQATASPSGEVGIMVGKDPETGMPMESVAAKGNEKRKNATVDRAMNSIVTGYKQTGVLGQDWDTVNSYLESDLYGPMRKYMVESMLEKNAARISALPAEYQEDARMAVTGRAEALAGTWFNYIQSEVEIRNAAAGGGTRDNPGRTRGLYTPPKPEAMMGSRAE